MTQINFPLAPLARALGVEMGTTGTDRDGNLRGIVGLATMLNTNNKQICRWKKNGIPALTADRLAIKGAHMNPRCIWPDWR